MQILNFAGVPRGEEYWIMVSHNGNIRHCARSVFRPVGIAPIRGRHSALTGEFSLVGIQPIGIRARTRFRDGIDC